MPKSSGKLSHSTIQAGVPVNIEPMNPPPVLSQPRNGRYHKTNGPETSEIEEINAKLAPSEMAENYKEPFIAQNNQEPKKFNPSETRNPDEHQNAGSNTPDST